MSNSKPAPSTSKPTNPSSKPNPNWPSRTGKPSGGGRGNNPPSKKK